MNDWEPTQSEIQTGSDRSGDVSSSRGAAEIFESRLEDRLGARTFPRSQMHSVSCIIITHLSQWFSSQAVSNTVIAGNAIGFLKPFFPKIVRFILDFFFETLNKLGLGVRSWINDIVVT